MPTPTQFGGKDGDEAPDALVEQTDNALDEWMDRFQRLQDEAKEEGFATALVVGCYDQLTDTCHSKSQLRGGFYTCLGMMRWHVAQREKE